MGTILSETTGISDEQVTFLTCNIRMTTKKIINKTARAKKRTADSIGDQWQSRARRKTIVHNNILGDASYDYMATLLKYTQCSDLAHRKFE